MPARISRGSSTSKAKTKNRNKSQKRSLQAFAIASAENGPERNKIRRHRLGQIEDDGPRRKRQRADDDEDSDNEDGPSGAKRSNKRSGDGRSDELDISEGSDSEGNRWKMGVVDEDDDSDIDSDDAFGSSDEERFTGFTFRGGSSGKEKSRRKKKVLQEARGNDLDLEEGVSEAESEINDSLGEDAVDLATMLDDDYESDESEEDDRVGKGRRVAKQKGKALVNPGIVDGSSSPNEDEDDDGSMSDMEDADDEDQIARLHNLVSGLQPAETSATRKHREQDSHETRAPSTSGLVSSEKFDIKDFLTSTSDPQLKKMSKQLGTIPKTLKKDPKLTASLPKRQKDKLDRVAANEKAKETLGRWVDTVKHNRRADHLMFPLQDPEAAKPHGSRHLLPTNQSAPLNDLENAIHNILQESGLVSGNPDEEENRIREFEELKTNQMPLEEVQARRAELRKARDLLFREEIRSKRVKKIKSKAYRRVHRKEREKLSALDRDAFAEGGNSDLDPEDRDRADRQRAEERMGAKHRDSKWAKQMKKSGRSVWDEDARSGVSEMAQRNEELRRRIEGKETQNENASDGEVVLTSDDEDAAGDSDLDGEAAEFQSLQRQLSRIEGTGEGFGSGPGTRLSSMKFMQQAEAARKARNDEDVALMRKELAGNQGTDESEPEESIGRKIFGLAQKVEPSMIRPQPSNEFEEPIGSDEEEWVGIDPTTPTSASAELSHSSEPKVRSSAKGRSSQQTNAPQTSKSKKQELVSTQSGVQSETIVQLLPGEKHSQPDTDGWVTVNYDNDSGAEEKERLDGESVLDQAEILRRAFAGDDVEEIFEEEKQAAIADEDEKIIDDTLPGWGSWVGEGLSKREKQRNTGRIFRKENGIKPQDRKDAKLKHVIVNQKRVKKNVSYMATTLPFPFTSKAEYERSIRMPIGGEWNVKEMYQANTKPRVLVKPGAIIKPMQKPTI